MARGWCSAHYRQWAAGKPPAPLRRYEKVECAVEWCDELAKVKGYCHRCYKRVLRGSPPLDAYPRPYRRKRK